MIILQVLRLSLFFRITDVENIFYYISIDVQQVRQLLLLPTSILPLL